MYTMYLTQKSILGRRFKMIYILLTKIMDFPMLFKSYNAEDLYNNLDEMRENIQKMLSSSNISISKLRKTLLAYSLVLYYKERELTMFAKNVITGLANALYNRALKIAHNVELGIYDAYFCVRNEEDNNLSLAKIVSLSTVMPITAILKAHESISYREESND